MDERHLQEAAQKLARRAGELRAAKAENRESAKVIQLHRPALRRMDDIERESRIRWIQALARAYRPAGMDLIVKQAMIGKRYMSDLSDDELMDLHHNLDRARECMADGITFEEAGLLRSHG